MDRKPKPKTLNLNLKGLSLVSLVGHSNSGVVDVDLCGPRVEEQLPFKA